MNRWKLIRFEHGLTVSELSKRAGVARQTISNLENGDEPNAPTAKALADAYGMSVRELLVWPHDDDGREAA